MQTIAQESNQQGQSWTEEEVLAEIKDWYNGYRFSEETIYVYNPFSTSRGGWSWWEGAGTASLDERRGCVKSPKKSKK